MVWLTAVVAECAPERAEGLKIRGLISAGNPLTVVRKLATAGPFDCKLINYCSVVVSESKLHIALRETR